MSIKNRIVSGALVNVVGMAMAAAAQLASVPVLTSAWGVDRYGAWLMLFTIPAYLALSDVGFTSAATSDMTMQVARGYTDQARATFQSVLVLVNAISLAAISAAFIVVVVLPATFTSLAWLADQSTTVLLFALYPGVALNGRVALAGLRATENYAFGNMLLQTLLLVEVFTALATAHFGGGFIAAAAAMVGVQTVTTVLMFAALRIKVRWLSIGFGNASLAELARLWAPAVAAMAIPAALAINLQGMVMVTGMFVSASAAATLASVRTVSRIAVQIVGAVNRATMPELSAAGARAHHAASSKIVALNLATVGLVLLPGAALFAAFGSHVVGIWTRGKINPDVSFVTLIALATVAHGFWYYTTNLMLASNQHMRTSRLLVFVSIISIALAVPAAHFFGLVGIGAVLLASEVLCLAGVIKTAFEQRLLSLADFESAFTLRFWRS